MIGVILFLLVQKAIWTERDISSYATVYSDQRRHFFLALDGTSFVFGVPISQNDTGADVPYIDGSTVDCSDTTFRCSRFGAISLAIPKASQTSFYRANGLFVHIARQADGSWVGDGTCEAGNDANCFTRRSGFPIIKYHYVVSVDGEVQSIDIRYLGLDGNLYQRRNMILIKGRGIKVGC